MSKFGTLRSLLILGLLSVGTVNLGACGDASEDGDQTPTPDAGADTNDDTPDPDPDTSPDPTPDTDDDTSPNDADPVEPSETTLTTIHDEIFATSCAGIGCHTMGGSLGGLNLDNDGGLRARLLLPSSASGGMPYVTPGDAQLSYLWHKVAGTHIDVGGNGTRMPVSPTPLPEAQLDMLVEWIEAGAPE